MFMDYRNYRKELVIVVNKVFGYRKMVGITQKQAAEHLGISTNTFANKEKGKNEFTKSEMKSFHILVSKNMPNIKLEEIFFEI